MRKLDSNGDPLPEPTKEVLGGIMLILETIPDRIMAAPSVKAATKYLTEMAYGLVDDDQPDALAAMAATIAAGTEAGAQLTPAPPDGREQWGSAEDVARRAVAIARAILAEVSES